MISYCSINIGFFHAYMRKQLPYVPEALLMFPVCSGRLYPGNQETNKKSCKLKGSASPFPSIPLCSARCLLNLQRSSLLHSLNEHIRDFLRANFLLSAFGLWTTPFTLNGLQMRTAERERAHSSCRPAAGCGLIVKTEGLVLLR